MKVRNIGKIESGQDGAIWQEFLFRFSANGECGVYRMAELGQAEPCARFILDKATLICPHSNAVFFGCEYYEAGDEFPLLYTNVYNTYKASDNRREGECCVYRIWREGEEFKSKLVQIIKIGFTEDTELWKSLSADGDVRSYGNFVLDRVKRKLYAFVMRDKNKKTRFFSFNLPSFKDGIFDSKLGVAVKIIDRSEILSYFDTDYMQYMQGACFYGGKIYSLEGFTSNEKYPPAIRVINVESKAEELFLLFADFGLSVEPEFIDFYNDTCYYIDAYGSTYVIAF